MYIKVSIKVDKKNDKSEEEMQLVTVIAIVSIALNIALLIWGMAQKIGLYATTWILVEKQVEVNANDMRKAQKKVIKKLFRIKT